METAKDTNMDVPEPLEVDEERGISVLDGKAPVSMSAVTFDGSAAPGVAGVSKNSQTTTGTRKIQKQDVKNVFRASTTRAPASPEQIRRIKMMHDKISDGVNWDFNYSCLLMVACVVAGLGLATGSSTTVISSMLLSPIMGPVLGMSYGLIIWDLPLIKRSARNEILSVVVCVVFGFLIGLSCFWTQMAEQWPTSEMYSRGTRTTFLAGIPIAFFSGLGVAVSVLDDQTSSLVGVAISASLLPPAVNCGMLLIVAGVKDNDWANYNFNFQFQEELAKEYLKDVLTFSQLGLNSLMLTVANVIMVAIGATFMFRLKEVLPVNKKIFWDDLKVARRIYQGRAVDESTGEALSVEQVRTMLSDSSGNPTQ